MEGAEQLLTISEIGAAFAGFTGVIGVLGRTPGTPVSAETRARLWLMVEFSIATIFFGLIPFAFYNANEPNEALVWAASSIWMIVFIVIHMIVGGRWSSRIVAPGTWPRWEPRVAIAGFVLIAAIHAANVLGLWGEPAFRSYFVGLLMFLLIAAFNFVALLAALWSEKAR